MSITGLMQTSATIQRRAASTTDSHGSPVSATSSTASVKCYIEQKPSVDETLGHQNTARAEYLVVLPSGTGIDASDRIVIGSTTYQVVSIPWSVKDAPTGNEHHVEVTVEEVTG
jgi:hypothetical protein